ncbi:MAG TPA: PaeR7I family type II restriction endonuclease [Parafilimonas sp.]|nr:PaeR7I family type II restriction endonuclease [Parafilimonas sp.]
MSKLLPNSFDELVSAAIKQFWTSRTSSVFASQAGGRGSVIAGKNLDGFSVLIKIVAQHCGVPDDSIVIIGKKNLTIPGFFRPTKMWDSIVVYKGRLIAAFELKSQVGPSFGNNFNNRTEESIGSAKDFWTAHREKAFELSNFFKSGLSTKNSKGIKPPFLGYLMLLEDCASSTCNVKVEEAHFKIFPEFKDTSYAKRYQLLCEKLVAEGLYSSASLILSKREAGKTEGKYSFPTETLSPTSLFADFAGRLLSAIETYK